MPTLPIELESVVDVRFKLSDVATISSPLSTTEYRGHIDESGHWLIVRVIADGTSMSIRYAGGSRDYEANWVNRANLVYHNYYDYYYDDVRKG